ncbi:MAG: 4Fe-4S binding protein [Lawsonibacter sp.]
MGCGSRQGKMSSTPRTSRWWRPAAVGCRRCTTQCAHGAITFGEDRKASIDWDKCVGCGRCVRCAAPSIRPGNGGHGGAGLPHGGVRQGGGGRPSPVPYQPCHRRVPYCDCHGENDLPIVPDVGMFASFDPVLDQACDACGKQPPSPAPTWTSRCTGRLRQPTTSSTACRTPTGGCAWPTVRKSASAPAPHELVEVK